MIRWLRRRRRTEALACQQLVELVTDYLEGALSPDLLRAFHEHVADCGNCTEYLRQMRRTIELERGVGAAGGWPATGATATEALAAGAPPMLDALLAEFRARHPR